MTQWEHSWEYEITWLHGAKRNLIKGLLRMILPNPINNPEDGKIMRFIKTRATVK